MLWERGKPYSQDRRERVLASADAGLRVGQIAERLQVSISYVSKVLSRRRMTGETQARPQRCHVPPKRVDLYEAIRQQVTSTPDATLPEWRAWLLATHQVSVSEGLMCETLARLGLTRKKSRSGRRSRIAPTLPKPALRGERSSPT